MNIASLADGALLLMDSAPIIYFLGGTRSSHRFSNLSFGAHDAGILQFAVTTIALTCYRTVCTVNHVKNIASRVGRRSE
jgi:hypothetical protein